MDITAKPTTTITLTITADDAQHLLNDFDKRQEPSLPGKALYATLAGIVRAKDESAAARLREAFGMGESAPVQSSSDPRAQVSNGGQA